MFGRSSFIRHCVCTFPPVITSFLVSMSFKEQRRETVHNRCHFSHLPGSNRWWLLWSFRCQERTEEQRSDNWEQWLHGAVRSPETDDWWEETCMVADYSSDVIVLVCWIPCYWVMFTHLNLVAFFTFRFYWSSFIHTSYILTQSVDQGKTSPVLRILYLFLVLELEKRPWEQCELSFHSARLSTWISTELAGPVLISDQ